MLGRLATLRLSSQRLSFTDPVASAATTLAVTGRDAEGYAAPIEAQDMRLDYDHAVLRVDPVAGGGLKLTPLANGATHLIVTVGGLSQAVAISVGVVTTPAYAFAGGANTRWVLNGTANTGQTATDTPDGLQIAYGVARNMGVTAGGDPAREVALPGQPLRVDVELKTTQATTLDSIGFYDANDVAYTVYGTPPTTSTDWQTVQFTVPAGIAFPLRLNSFQLIETDVSKQRAGQFTLRSVSVDGATPVDPVTPDPPRADPIVAADGATPAGTDFSLATLAGTQLSAADPLGTLTAIGSIERVRATSPDLIVLDGDVSAGGAAADMTLARQTLTQAGCQPLPLSSTLGTELPTPAAGTTPCLYLPGDREASAGALAPFTSAFGQPYGTVDHDGTRLILLASSLGSLYATSFDQLVLLRRALDDARSNAAIEHVLVFANAPVDDPDPAGRRQLGNRTEVQLVEQLLSDFRAASGKPAAMVGAQPGIAGVERLEGIPYLVTPNAAGTPGGTPDRGGFTGWTRLSVGGSARWLSADVHAFAQSIALDAPAALEVGESTQLAGSLTQPGGRVVPLASPLSVHWSGSDALAIGSGEAAVDAARAAGRAAILDPASGRLTALRSGRVTVTVSSDSQGPAGDAAALAPVTASRTIATQVTHVSQPGGAGGDVPATLALTLGAPASFGAFAPGLAKTYTTTQTATVTSSAGDATLSVADASTTATGHLVNGGFALREPLQVAGSALPTMARSWTAPTANEPVAIPLAQAIDANEGLRTGSYGATLQFTLATATP